MVATSLDGVRSAFGDDELAAEFGRAFIDVYAANALGVLPKREIDLLVFSFLVRRGVIDADGSMYRVARALNITPTKAKALLFEHQLRNVSESETDHAVMIALTTARFWKDGVNLSFGINSPLVKAAIAGKMQDRGVFADISLSGDILRVNPEHFGKILAELVSNAQADRLIERLKGKGLTDHLTVRKAIAAAGQKAGAELVTAGSTKALEALLKGIKGLASGGALDILASVVDAL